MNFFQLYIGYIGASRAYGLHFELMDAALFLTNEGITIYLGHKHRWARKWQLRARVVAGHVAKSKMGRTEVGAAPTSVVAPVPASAIAKSAGPGALVAAHVPVRTYAPVVSLVPLTMGMGGGPKLSTPITSKPASAGAVQPRVDRARRERVEETATA